MKDRILRISEADLNVSEERTKALINGMVNAKTPGYQKSEVVTRAFPIELQAAINRENMRASTGAMEPKIEGTFYNRIKGALLNTGGNLDVAIGGNGYFVVEGPESDLYTRDGRFMRDQQGNLITVSGNFRVLGEGGPINLDIAENVTIASDGKILVDGKEEAKLKVVTIDVNSNLQPVTGSFFRAEDKNFEAVDDTNPQVIQGYIETSNSSVIDQMMDLIFLSKKVAISAKVVQARDTDLSAAFKMGEVSQ